MNIFEIHSTVKLEELAKELFSEERAKKRLDGWFLAQEISRECQEKYAYKSMEMRAALALQGMAEHLPLTISDYSIFAGTQDDAFAKSYALINPSFQVETFTGYNDPCAVFNDIEPNEEFSQKRIDDLLTYYKEIPYVKALNQTNNEALQYSDEAVFFVEQVTGHIIPDFKPLLKHGALYLITKADEAYGKFPDEKRRDNISAMRLSLEALLLLAERYADIASEKAKHASGEDAKRFALMERTLRTVPYQGAQDLYEAIQLFILAWQCMCIEQQTNPFAFSVGNADRIFEPYRAMKNTSQEEAAKLFEHLLVFFNVGDRSWAISQNVILGGRSLDGTDLSSTCTYALMDAYYTMNLPQPILSVKLHNGTPDEMYSNLGKFLFTSGCLTPSFFNDDSVFEALKDNGVEDEDLEDYSIAGCQEPLIMGKDNGNTTNSWLNLAKVLEITLTGGYSTITGKKIGQGYRELGYTDDDALTVLSDIRRAFYKNLNDILDIMVEKADMATTAISYLPVPFLSTAMGGLETGIDMRDVEQQGTKYNGSGCLIHGLTVVADSFIAIDDIVRNRPQDAQRLLSALGNNFEGEEAFRQYLFMAPKFGNGIEAVDKETEEIARLVADMVHSKRNYLGNPFRPDFSSPSTHLLYGYWVGAMPSGRKAREMLNYGIDPLYGEATNGVGLRMMSVRRLPFNKMCGGYASHFGLDPRQFRGNSFEEKGLAFKDNVIKPLFFSSASDKTAPFYLYVNITTPETLRKVLADPKKYAPSGVYIMRIHGTFVNFLDLSPAIQQDIIKRLDLGSTAS